MEFISAAIAAIADFATDNAAVVGFLGGGLAAWAVGSIVTYWIRHPVIGACLDERRGSYLPASVEEVDDQGKRTGITYTAKYLRLHIENTGLSSIKDCAGYITEITKCQEGKTVASSQEVLFLGWSNRGADPRSIPRGAFSIWMWLLFT